jgi:hypothetical protein
MLMDNAVVWPGAFIRNSVIGFGAVVGPGAVLGAERLESSKKQSPTSRELGVVLGITQPREQTLLSNQEPCSDPASWWLTASLQKAFMNPAKQSSRRHHTDGQGL